MIAQLNSYPENTATTSTVTETITRNTILQTYAPTFHDQIRLIDTPADRFCTEIVADALKLAGTGKRVLIVQLLKGGIRQGHDQVVNLAQNLDWIRCNLIRNIAFTECGLCPIADLNDLELHNFQQLWKHVRNVAKLGEYSLLILDDLSLAIELGLISVEAATDFLTTIPADLEILLTGTNSHPAILELTA
jgi:cob(I)alamin adenosyltransferase